MKKQISSFKSKPIIFGIIIAIVLSAFVLYTIQTIYPSPKYEDFCDREYPIPLEREINITQETCEDQGGIWQKSYCDFYSECQQEYDTAQNKHNLAVFFITIIFGLALVITGVLTKNLSISLGLMISGGFLTFFGTVISWTDLSNWLRTLVLGLVLATLLWIAYKKLD